MVLVPRVPTGVTNVAPFCHVTILRHVFQTTVVQVPTISAMRPSKVLTAIGLVRIVSAKCVVAIVREYPLQLRLGANLVACALRRVGCHLPLVRLRLQEVRSPTIHERGFYLKLFRVVPIVRSHEALSERDANRNYV